MIAVGTILFELAAPILIVSSGLHSVFVIVALVFHLNVFLTMRIAFWHLWVFYPALFL